MLSPTVMGRGSVFRKILDESPVFTGLSIKNRTCLAIHPGQASSLDIYDDKGGRLAYRLLKM